MQEVENVLDSKLPGFVPCLGGTELHQAMETLFGKQALLPKDDPPESSSVAPTHKIPKPEALKKFTMENEVEPHMRELIYSVNRCATLSHRFPTEFDHLYHYGLLLQEFAAKLRYELEMNVRQFSMDIITELLSLASEKYEEALKIRPGFHAAFYNWGVALSELSSIWKPLDNKKSLFYLHSASQKYSQAIELCADNPRGLNNWGLVLQEVSNYEMDLKRQLELATQAIDKFRGAIRLRLDFDHGCYNMGTIFYTHATNLKDSDPEALIDEDGNFIAPLRGLVGEENQLEEAVDVLMRSAAQYICLAAALEPTNKVYQGSVAVVKHILPRPYLKVGYLTVARYGSLDEVRESWEKQWFVLDSYRLASGIGLQHVRGSNHVPAKLREREEPTPDQYNIPVEEMTSIDRCLELSLPQGYGFWIQTKRRRQGFYFISEDLESANAWVDCLKLSYYISSQNKSQGLRDILGP